MRHSTSVRSRVGMLLTATAAVVLAVVFSSCGTGIGEKPVRVYNLEIVPTDIDYGGGNVWHAWTFKLAGAQSGTVPGPTLVANVGEKLRVHVTNKLDIVHSFHTHLTGYDQESDGSQANIISGVGSGAMIPPGGEFTYEFEPTKAGIFYYHCHSADGGHHIAEHIGQGLYGAIIVKSPNEASVRDEVIFMGEMGFDTEGENVPQYLMNGMGLPGGEHALEGAYEQGGFDAVASQLNKTVPAIEATVGEEMRVHVINIGDQMHSFHPHNVDVISEEALDGRQWPADVVPLVPGAADTVSLTFTKPGLWLFHCHVVSHADAGMIGLFIIREKGEPAVLPTSEPGQTPAATSTGPPPETAVPLTATATVPGEQGTVELSLSEWQITGADGGDVPSVAAGPVTFEVQNEGTTQHELVVIDTDTDPAGLPTTNGHVDEAAAGAVLGRTAKLTPRLSETLQLDLAPGNYVLICNIPPHYEQGMHARLVVH